MKLKKLFECMSNLDYVFVNVGVIDDPILYQISDILDNHKDLLKKQVLLVQPTICKQGHFLHENPVIKVILEK